LAKRKNLKANIRVVTRRIPPLPPRHKMNKLETRYRDLLEARKQAGDIIDYVYEGITFRLASRTTYTPDFLVVMNDCFEIHEVKGYWRDDARVKWKLAAEKFPWLRFVAVQWRRKQWVFEYYDGEEVVPMT